MKIAILGTGAMGSVYAALLAAAGNEVWAIDPWRAHIDAIRATGLRVEGASGDRLVASVKATVDPAEAGPCDLVIVATKARDVEAAVRGAGPLLSPQTAVLFMQNGLGSSDLARAHLPPGRALLGVAQAFGASMKGPGHAHHNAMDLIRIGEVEGGPSERVSRLVETWQEAGFRAQGEADITRLIWEKFVCNVTFSAPCTVFGRLVGAMMDDPATWRICTGCAVEAYRAGQARGVPFSFDDPVAYVTAYGGKVRGARPSMLLDHLARRPSEIDFLNGAAARLSQESGLDAPYNETLAAIVRDREAAF